MRKSTLFKTIISIIILVLVLIGCQVSSQNSESNVDEMFYAIDHITLNNKINGVDINIQEAKIVKNDPDYLIFTYIITNNTKNAINWEAYKFTIRGYSEDGFLLFECKEENTFQAKELDVGKKANNTSYQKIYPPKDKVYEIIIDFDINSNYAGWW